MKLQVRNKLFLAAALFGAACQATITNAATISFTNALPISPTSRLWSTAVNWNPNAVPADGDSLTFSGSGKALTNDLTGLKIDTITFPSGGNWFLYPQTAGANGITVSNALIWVAGGSAANRVNLNVQIVNPSTVISNNYTSQDLRFGESGGTSTPDGAITGTGGVVINGAGKVGFYNGGNSYDGNTVINGTLFLAGNTATLIPNGFGKGNVTVNTGGLLNVNGKSEVINGLGGGGTITNGGGSCTLTVGDSDATSTFSGNIVASSGALAVEKIGAGTLTLSGVNTFSGETKVSGGTLKLGNPSALQNSAVNLNGGNLSFSATTAATLGGVTGFGTVTLQNDSSAAVALTLGKADATTVTLTGAVDGSGSIVKTNSNRQNLNGVNTFIGSITVAQGTLGLTSSHTGTGPVSVKDGATLALDGTSGTSVTLSSLTAGVSTGASLNLGINTGSAAPALNVTNLTNQGIVTLNVNASGTFAVGGTHPLITYAGSVGGGGTVAFQLGTLPVGVVGHLQFVAGTVNLVVDAVVNSLTWTGAANNQWDTSSINWQDAALTALTYTNQYGTNLLGDIVTFDDTGAAQPNVILSAVLRPARINWSAGATDYSFTGSGGISGTGQAVKTGNSTVTLTTSNDYSGGTLINAGTVAVTHPNSLGSGSVRLHSALRFTNSASFNFSNTLYNDPGADMVYDVASGTVVNLTGNLTLTGGGSVNRAVITKQGAGTLKFAGTSVIDSSSSRLLINVGEVSVTTPMSFGGHGQCVTVGSLDNTAKLIVDATTLGVVGNYELRLGDGGGSGTLVITNGGTFSGNQLTIAQGNTTSGFNATGQVYQASGAVTLSGAVVLGANNAYTVIPVTPSSALYQLNGGTLTTTGIQRKDTNVLAIARFNGGTLKAAGSGTLISPFGTAEIQSGGLTLDTDGNSPAITQVLSGGGALIKTGSGTLNLNTNNTYTGVTTVSAGALGGSGSIAGNLVVSSGSFEPGVAGIGTFTVGGSAWITNQALFQLNKTQSPSNDLAVITGALTAGGTLTVTNLGAGAAGALTNGDFFKLFSKPVSGSFSTLALPTLAPDLAWKNDLGVDGSISVIAALTTPNPTNIVVTNIGGGQLVLNWPAGEGWQLQAQTNSGSIGLSTNWVNVTGATPPFTNSIDLTNGAVFYRLKY